jgi:2-dehydropantoate 2-reductase
MEPFRGRIGIIGSGALGCFYGARLSRAGFDVHFLMRRDFDAVRENGLKVFSFEGDFVIRPPVFASALSLGLCDLVIVGFKTTDNHVLPDLLGPSCNLHTVVLTLQNGLGNEEAVALALAAKSDARPPSETAKQVMGGTAFLCSTRTEPGVVCHTDHGFIRLAEFSGGPRERTRAIAEMFRCAGIDCAVRESVAAIRWEKLVWNIPFNGLGVAAGRADTAAILSDPDLRGTVEELMLEVIAGARADGAEIDPGLAADLMKKTETMGAYRSSMQIDYECGRPVEVEAILGEPLRRARCAGVATPRLQMLYGIVRRLDYLNRLDKE